MDRNPNAGLSHEEATCGSDALPHWVGNFSSILFFGGHRRLTDYNHYYPSYLRGRFARLVVHRQSSLSRDNLTKALRLASIVCCSINSRAYNFPPAQI